MKQNFTIFFSFFCKSNDKVVVDLVEHMHIYLSVLLDICSNLSHNDFI